jgi:hypothetical protein
LSLAELRKAIAMEFPKAEVPTERQSILEGLILLWHDHLDAAHEIAQADESADGSLLHAIMHRREPDYGNSKYWFRLAGRHASFAALTRDVAEHADPSRVKSAKLLREDAWDPFAFVDACERARRSGNQAEIAFLQAVQEMEFKSFFNYLMPGGRQTG